MSKRPLAWNVASHEPQLVVAGYVHDQRIPCRPLLRLEDCLHRRRVEGIRAQPVNGLGGERHSAAPAQELRGLVQRRHR